MMSTRNEAFNKLRSQGVVQPWEEYDDYPINEVPLGAFKQLPTLNVWGTKPFNFWDYATNKFADFITIAPDNPFVGKVRQNLVGKYYGSDNTFRQGNDDVANGIMAILLTTATGLGLGAAAKALATEGFAAIPGVLASIAGAKGGQVALDKVTEKLTGRTWTQHVADAGLNNYNQMLFQPGAWGGSYAASKLVNGLITNGVQQVFNQIPRETITPNGPRTIQAGESVTEVMPSRTIGYQQFPQGSFNYSARYTTNGGSGVNSGTGLPYGAYGQVRRMGDFIGSNKTGTTFTDTYYNPMLPMSPVSGYMSPWFNVAPTPPRPVSSETLVYKPDIRYEEYTPYGDPFLEWFGGMKGTDKENTIQYWNGSPYSTFKSGPYFISWSNISDPRFERRRVGDNEGWVVPDSTTVVRSASPRDEVNQLTSGVPDEAKRSDEKIKGFKIGGKLIKKRRK